MTSPLVSVITPFLDAERFLAECVESVLAQRWTGWELLLVDDGSSDGSTALARRYARRPRIRYLEHPRHENRGVVASRNLALEQARGEYLACLDSDDTWFPETLERQISMLEANPRAAMAYGTSEWWHTWNGADRPDWPDGVGNKVEKPDSLVDPPALLALFLRDGGAVPCWCSVVFRTAAVRTVGGFDDPTRADEPHRDLYEDQVLYTKLFLEWPVYVTEATLGRYRQHEHQLCAQAKESGAEVEARARFLDWVGDYLDARGGGDADVRDALTHARAELGSVGRG